MHSLHFQTCFKSLASLDFLMFLKYLIGYDFDISFLKSVNLMPM